MTADRQDRSQHTVGAIILAAGIARRAGTTKQLLELNGRPLLQHVIDNATSSSADRGVIVLGHDAALIRQSINPQNFVIVENRDYATGQASSLIAGIGALPADCDAAIVLLGDQPGVDASVIDQVAERFQSGAALIVIATWQGKRGNPVLLSRALFSEIEHLTGDTGARAIFHRHENDIEAVEFDRPMPLDVDTLDDYLNLTADQAK